MKCKWCGKEIANNRKYCSLDCKTKDFNNTRKTKEMILRLAQKGGYKLENFDKIVRAKVMLFKDGDTRRCPCDAQDSERFCGSAKCQNDIILQGHCHCNLFHLTTEKE